jgi:radical SAM-linked protein
MRLRITFSKTDSLRYIGHLDLHTVWERTVRRAGLPLLYTQGFHPTPRIQLACALPLGFSGRCEIVDIWVEDLLATGLDFINKYVSVIQPAAPPGLTILSAEKVEENSPALQTQVVSAQYEVSLLDPLTAAEKNALPDKISALLGALTLPAERRGKPYDLRLLIEDLRLTGEDDERPQEGLHLTMRLAAREGATGRPEAVLEALGIPFESTRVERTRILLKDGSE